MNRKTTYTPLSTVAVFAQESLQSAMFEGLVVIRRGAKRDDVIPHTWREREWQ